MNELDLFAAAIAISNPGERATLLDRECAGRPDVRQRIEQLLEAHFRAHPFFDQPGLEQTGAYVSHEQSGVMIAGRYKLLEQIGEGGMGAVWVAEQTQPVRRKVALKLIKAGMDSKSVIARFEAERQALAVMDHPNVAKVLDGGLTETGRPFFAMEYVKGVPITEFCDAARLSVTERLQLFAQVCQAVQHAHQKGIIHRDLKPSNILVAPYDDKPVPKIIDFGLAKAMHQSLTEKTLHTAHETVLGTPLYMSPEQAQLNNLDVDTRSDIYSLGVLLYELLTGTMPLEKQRFKEAAWDEIRRIIREEEPPRPSARLSSMDTLPSLAAFRHTEPLKLTSQIRGELDWIVMKALEKDRTRRYDTANGLAADIGRYLAGEPVMAHPPSTAYRLKKFVSRNRRQVIASSLVLLALVAGIIGTTLGLLEAKRHEALARVEAMAKEQARAAEAAERRKAEEAKVEAQAKAAEANAVVKFFEGQVFAAARPKGQEGGQGAAVTLRDAIAASEPVLDKSFTTQPLVEARLRMTLGITFSYLAEYEQARKQFERARDLYVRHLGPEHPLTLSSLHNLANSYDDLNRPAESLKLREDLLESRKRVLPKDHPDTLKSMLSLAGSYADLNRQTEALKLREDALEIQKRVLPRDHLGTLGSMYNLAISYRDLNRRAEALELFEEVLRIQKRALPEGHPATLKSMLGVADGYSALNRPAEALKLQEEVLEIQKRVLPKDHPDTLRSMGNLAFTYAALDRQSDALKLREEAVEIMKRVMPKNHPDTLASMNNLSLSYMDLNRHDEALKLQEEVLEIQKQALPKDHPDTLMSMNNLANSYTMLNRPAEALKLQEEVLESRRRVLPKDHPATLGSMVNLANSYRAVGRVLDAVEILEQALSVMRQKMPEHQFTFNCLGNLANLYANLDRQDEALKLREELLETEKRVLPKDHPETLETMVSVANSYASMNRQAEALKLQEQALEIQKRVLPKDDPATLTTMNNLANSYGAVNRPAEALALHEEVLEIRRRVLPKDDPDTLMSMVNLAALLVDAGRAAEGIALIDEFLPKANRPHVHPGLVPSALGLRMAHFRKAGDPAECRATAEMWEKLNFTDADGLYNTACFRAIASAVQAKTSGTDAARLGKEDADKAMEWLQKAVKSGYKDGAHMKEDTDLDSLRDREDFKTLVSELEKAQKQ